MLLTSNSAFAATRGGVVYWICRFAWTGDNDAALISAVNGSTLCDRHSIVAESRMTCHKLLNHRLDCCGGKGGPSRAQRYSW
jgi:hypothetical protein